MFLWAMACALTLAPSGDYRYLLLSGISGPWQLSRNGRPWTGGDPLQRFLLADATGRRSFPREGSLPLDEGTIELRIALREPGSSTTYTQDRTLFGYRSAGADYLNVAQSGSAGIVYFGGQSQGQWQSAYSGRGLMRGWSAGEWHHLAATYSASASRMVFYVDGALAADTNEHHYWPPAATGGQFTIDATAYDIRDVVISARPLDADEIRAHAARTDRPQAGEIWIPTAGLAAGDSLSLASGDCASATLDWRGIPARNPRPASTLLPPATSSIDFDAGAPPGVECRYAVNANPQFGDMTPLAGKLEGLSGDARQADQVWLRCSDAPDYALGLSYRSLPAANPHYPRKSNLWGSSLMLSHGYDFAAKVDVYLGAEMAAADIRALRSRNPEILVLTSINTVENHGLPEDYYLHDTHGNKIEVWPGTYRLNLTKPYVAEYQARWAYRKMLDSGLMYDGCFFDNFFTAQSWLKTDIYGNAVQVDADEDGKPDDPAALDAAWREGVFHELAVWRELMPHAYASGHLPNPVTSDVGSIFNGNSILFWAVNVEDGQTSFAGFWNVYQGWSTAGRAPVLSTIESSPQNQIAYGYGYDILKSMPAATQAFARDYYPYLRFPLAFALMRDGSFHRDLGDVYHGNDWWYDEYDFDLGYPTGPASLMPLDGSGPAPNLVDDGDFEQPLAGTWNLAVDSRGTAAATLTRELDPAVGGYSARIDVTATSLDWHVDFNQRDRTFEKGKSYDLTFWAKAAPPRAIGLASQKQVPDWRNYGLSGKVAISGTWQQYTVSFQASETANDSRVQFFLGDVAGTVWIDGVELRETPPQVWRRDFTNGAALLNGTSRSVTVAMPGYERFRGGQAPKYQYIVDDTGAGFTADGAWRVEHFDTGQWKAAGPYYHHWGTQCQSLTGSGSAQWDLRVPAAGTYTLEAWWAGAPEQAGWSKQAVYEVVSAGQVIATATLDQTAPGDQFRKIVTTPLDPAGKPVLRVRNGADGKLVADAIQVWSEERFNDGSPADSVTLAPLDGILLHAKRPNERGMAGDGPEAGTLHPRAGAELRESPILPRGQAALSWRLPEYSRESSCQHRQARRILRYTR